MTQRLNNNKHKNNIPGDFPGGPVVKNLLSNAGDMGLIPGWGTNIPQARGHRGDRPAHRPAGHGDRPLPQPKINNQEGRKEGSMFKRQ